jgi:hypothetical protein
MALKRKRYHIGYKNKRFIIGISHPKKHEKSQNSIRGKNLIFLSGAVDEPLFQKLTKYDLILFRCVLM